MLDLILVWGESLMSKIGISLSDASRLTFEEQLMLFEEVGFDCVEITTLNTVRNATFRKDEWSNVVRDTLSSYDFVYTVHAPFQDSNGKCFFNLGDSSSIPIAEKVFKACIDYSSFIDAELLVIHPPVIEPKWKVTEKEAMKVLVDFIRKIGKYASKLGITIGIENPAFDPSSFGIRIDELVELVNRVNLENVGVTLDFGHLYPVSRLLRFDYVAAIRCLLPTIVHIHINDNFGKKDPHSPSKRIIPLGYGRLPPGWGSIPFKKILSLIKPSYDGIYVLETPAPNICIKKYYELALKNVRKLIETC